MLRVLHVPAEQNCTGARVALSYGNLNGPLQVSAVSKKKMPKVSKTSVTTRPFTVGKVILSAFVLLVAIAAAHFLTRSTNTTSSSGTTAGTRPLSEVLPRLEDSRLPDPILHDECVRSLHSDPNGPGYDSFFSFFFKVEVCIRIR